MSNIDKNIEYAAEQIAKDIDFEVLTSAFIKAGWTKVVLEPMTWEQSYEIDEWVSTNVKGNFDTRGLVWVFKDSKDAMWFKIRWGSK